MSDFKFQVTDYVTIKAHLDLFELHEVQPLVVNERLAQQCEGGEQRSYLCRPILAPGRGNCAAFAAEPVGSGYARLKESELVALDVEAYRKAREKNAEIVWRPTRRALEDMASGKPAVKTHESAP